MKNRYAVVCAVFTLFVCATGLAATGRGSERPRGQPAREDEGDGTITYVKGERRIKPEGGAYGPVTVDQAVFSSDTVETSPGSEAEIALRDGSAIFGTEDSELTVSQSAIGDNWYTSIGLLIGRVKLVVGKLQKGGKFTVNTLTVTAGVRGTSFGADAGA